MEAGGHGSEISALDFVLTYTTIDDVHDLFFFNLRSKLIFTVFLFSPIPAKAKTRSCYVSKQQ